MANKLVAKEQEILTFWRDNTIFEKSVAKPAPAGTFVFYEGPPTANAAPGVHHVLARAFKDIFPRYKTMRGFRVVRKAGWDTHGLPVELQVEKKFGLKSKMEIEGIVSDDPHASIIKFNDECKQMVWSFKEDWEKLTARIGFWIDMSAPYITYQNSYIESVWAVIKKANERKLLYQGHKVVPYCTRCGTALSSHEVAQGYKEITEDSVFIRFKVVADHADWQNTSILSWTTTPWTLPGNVGLAINKNEKYICVPDPDISGHWLVLAEACFQRLLADGLFPETFRNLPTGQADVFAGAEMIGIRYLPLFEGAVESGDSKTAWTVQAADFVTTLDGTGVVHTAVMYGEDDYRLGEQVGLPKQHTVDQSGKFVDRLGNLAGRYVKDKETTELIYQHLKDSGAFYKIVSYTHDYPFCWRCDTPLIYYAKDSWFIAMSKLQKELLKNAKQINWVPSHIKEGRFGEWLNGIKDWAVSRERYWGTPLPVWRSQDNKTFDVVGSISELYQKAVRKNEFYTMRHGTAEHNISHRVNGDVATSGKYPLTQQGITEAHRAAKQAAKLGITKIVCSPFLRTKQTAEIIAKELGLTVSVDDAFVEVAMPEQEGQTEDQPLHNFGQLAGAESPAAVVRRMLKGVAALDNDHTNQKILIVSHGDPIWFTQGAVAGLEISPALAVDYPHHDGSVTLLPVLPQLITADGDYNIHRPYVDRVQLRGAGGQPMTRVNEVMDVWLDSGSMPFAQYHYPFENKKLIDKQEQFPAEFISEAIDQTRGWFYTLLAVSTIMDKGPSYKNVICLGHINDAKGQKMSKSKGNIVNPWSIIDEHGADALRWYLYTINQPGEPKNFDPQGVVEASRKPLALLDNVLSFYLLYAKNQSIGRPQPSHLLDRWIVARLNQLIAVVTAELDQYHVIESARAIGDFVTELSTWYVRRSRERFKAGDQLAIQTLGWVLLETAKLLAPYVPFFAESVYRDMHAGPLRRGLASPKQERGEGEASESVHLASWPSVDKRAIDSTLLQHMDVARQIVERGLAARALAKIKVRQPLPSYSTTLAQALPEEIVAIITDELNVKALHFGRDELDTTISDELAAEGLAREMIRQINQLRKETELTITDRVIVYQNGLDGVVEKFSADIKSATLATDIVSGSYQSSKPVGSGSVSIKKI